LLYAPTAGSDAATAILVAGCGLLVPPPVAALRASCRRIFACAPSNENGRPKAAVFDLAFQRDQIA